MIKINNIIDNPFDSIFLLPEIFLFWSILILLVFSIWFSNYKIYKYKRVNKALLINIINIIIFYNILLINTFNYNNIISSYLFFNNIYTLIFKILISFILIILILSSYDYLYKKQIFFFEFYILVLLSFLSMVLLIMSFDFILIYLTIEFQGLCFYVLVAINRIQNKSIEAALKYFILGSFSSSILGLGISIIYGITGLTNLKDLADFLNLDINLKFLNIFLFLGMIFICFGFFFKLAIAPFHIWLPDIFEGSLKIVLFLFSTLPKIVLIFIFYKIYNNILINIFIDWQYLFIFFIISSWIIGILGALRAKKLNILLAYSSINHIGFLLLIILLNNIHLLIIYLVIYALLLSNIFLILILLIKKNNNIEIFKIEQLIFLYKNNKLLALNLIFTLFSLAGIPPLSGFYSKFLIFIDLLNINWLSILFLSLIFSVFSCFYYIRIIKIIIFDNNKNWILLDKLNYINSYILNLFFIINIFFIFFISFFYDFFYFLLYNYI